MSGRPPGRSRSSWAVQLYQRGVPIPSILDATGLKSRSVYSAIQRAGVAAQKRSSRNREAKVVADSAAAVVAPLEPPANPPPLAVQLYLEGLPMAQIMATTNTTRQAVYAALKRAGVPVRTQRAR